MNVPYVPGSQTLSIGLLIARIVVGLLIAAHGSQKLFGWFGGHGLQATGELFGQLGFQPGGLFATAAATGERHADVASALQAALGQARVGDRILVFGSFHTVAAALGVL